MSSHVLEDDEDFDEDFVLEEDIPEASSSGSDSESLEEEDETDGE